MIPVAKKNTVQFFCNGVFLLKVKRFEKISGRAFAKTFFFGFDFGFFFPNS